MQVAKSKVVLVILLCLLCACSGGNEMQSSQQDQQNQQAGTVPASAAQIPSSREEDTGESAMRTEAAASINGTVTISFDYVRQSGSASNQFAVWIEDKDGNFLQTVSVTRWTANGGYKTRPDSIPLWVEVSGLASLSSNDVDAIAGATPQTGTFSCTWDVRDRNGNTVPPGEYRFFVEGTLRWKNYVLYSGVIQIGETPATTQAEAAFVYVASDNQPALTGDSAENAMIGIVTARYIPES